MSCVAPKSSIQSIKCSQKKPTEIYIIFLRNTKCAKLLVHMGHMVDGSSDSVQRSIRHSILWELIMKKLQAITKKFMLIFTRLTRNQTQVHVAMCTLRTAHLTAVARSNKFHIKS